MEDLIVRWVRAARVSTATRTDGVSVMLGDGAWWMLKGGQTSRLSGIAPLPSFLDRAIETADVVSPPEPWEHDNGVWVHAGWAVRPEGDGWVVTRSVGSKVERASRQTFASPDRARRWAELRFDRSEGGLRGPKPRAGSRSAAKLPDVRVTEAERDEANAILNGLGMPYAVFVRAALDWANESVLVTKTFKVDEASDYPRFIPVK